MRRPVEETRPIGSALFPVTLCFGVGRCDRDVPLDIFGIEFGALQWPQWLLPFRRGLPGTPRKLEALRIGRQTHRIMRNLRCAASKSFALVSARPRSRVMWRLPRRGSRRFRDSTAAGQSSVLRNSRRPALRNHLVRLQDLSLRGMQDPQIIALKLRATSPRLC